MNFSPMNVDAQCGDTNAAESTKEKSSFPLGVVFFMTLASYMLYNASGQTFITFASKVLLLLIIILFLWAKAARTLNRPLPPVPKMSISQETINKWATLVCTVLNKVLLGFENIALGKDSELFCMVAISLWLISLIGRFGNC